MTEVFSQGCFSFFTPQFTPSQRHVSTRVSYILLLTKTPGGGMHLWEHSFRDRCWQKEVNSHLQLIMRFQATFLCLCEDITWHFNDKSCGFFFQPYFDPVAFMNVVNKSKQESNLLPKFLYRWGWIYRRGPVSGGIVAVQYHTWLCNILHFC